MACRRLDAGAPFDIWAVDLMVMPDASGIATLSPRELARARALRFARDRRRYLAAHVALRRILAAHADIAPAAQVFEIDGHGKPRLAGLPDFGFNLSYAGDTALIGTANGAATGPNGAATGPNGAAIGIDIEALREIDDLDGMSATVFTATERAACRAVASGTARERRFLIGWTRKEACLKAIGSGLSIDPSTFEAGVDSNTRTTVIDDGLRRAEVEVGSFEVGSNLGAWARIARHSG